MNLTVPPPPRFFSPAELVLGNFSRKQATLQGAKTGCAFSQISLVQVHPCEQENK